MERASGSSRYLHWSYMFIGDFNVVLSVQDRINGVDISEQETQDFSEFMLVTYMLGAPNCGVYYSWTNKGLGQMRICSRIDISVISEHMLDLFPSLMVKYHPCGVLDHTPLVVNFNQRTRIRECLLSFSILFSLRVHISITLCLKHEGLLLILLIWRRFSVDNKLLNSFESA